jgi:hypothetical protein
MTDDAMQYCLHFKRLIRSRGGSILAGGAAMLFLFSAIVFPAGSESKKPYLAKEYVDTMIQRAVYELTAAASMTSFGIKQEDGVNKAKLIAEQLKLQAKNDPNRRYVFWRVGELEQQIYYEELEIFEKKKKERQIMINHLVDRFNTETAVKRPDFSMLSATLDEMESVDPRKAAEIEKLVIERRRGIAREVVPSIEEALEKDDIDRARRELDYCLANREYLGVPQPRYDALSAKLQARLTIEDEKSFITSDIRQAEQFMKNSRLGDAGVALDRAEKRLDKCKASMPAFEATTRKKIPVLADAIGRQEDSLVSINMLVLQEKGVDSALAYMNYLQGRYQVSREKVMVVDQQILLWLIAMHEEGDTAIHHEVEALSSGDDNGFSLDALRETAKKKAQARADSIRASQEKQRIVATLEKQPSFFERLRIAREERRKQREAEYGVQADRKNQPPRAVSAADATNFPVSMNDSPEKKPAVMRQAQQSMGDEGESEKEMADQHMADIYSLLQQKKVKLAQMEFTRYRPSLEKYVTREAIEMLESSINQAAADLLR